MLSVEKYITKIGKLDQPIYGYPQYDAQQNIHADQLLTINRIVDLIAKDLNRPLKILELNCAQGFFSLHLAAKGFDVLGIDSSKNNIELCCVLAKENPTLKVKFVKGKIEDIIKSIKNQHFDVIIGMNTFAQQIRDWNLQKVQSFMKKLNPLSDFAIIELYLQKNNELIPAVELLEPYSFFCEIQDNSVESSIVFYLSTNSLLLDNQLWKFDTWKQESHALAGNNHQKSRRYYFRDNRIIKFFRFDGILAKNNQDELFREFNFLSTNKNYPCIFRHQFSQYYGWIERELINGDNLLDLILSKKDFNTYKVIYSLLKQLVALEKSGLYHRDLRLWNIIISKNNNVHLIDYGDITNIKADVVYPENIFFSFFITINDLINREVHPILPIRAAKISPHHLPKPYCDWLSEVWYEPMNQWTFKLIYKKWLEINKNQLSRELLAQDQWNAKTEEYINTLRRYHDHEISELNKRFNQLKDSYDAILKRVIKLEKTLD